MLRSSRTLILGYTMLIAAFAGFALGQPGFDCNTTAPVAPGCYTGTTGVGGACNCSIPPGNVVPACSPKGAGCGNNTNFAFAGTPYVQQFDKKGNPLCITRLKGQTCTSNFAGCP